MRKAPIPIKFEKKNAAYLLSALALAACGTVTRLGGGSTAVYVPMRQVSWLLFGTAALLLLNVLLPLGVAALTHLVEERELRPFIAWLPRGIVKYANGISFGIYALVMLWFSMLFYRATRYAGGVATARYAQVFWIAISFLILLIVAKAMKYNDYDKRQGKTLSALFDVLRLNMAILAVGAALTATGVLDTAAALRAVEVVAALYCGVFLLFSAVNALIRKSAAETVYFTVPRLFSREKDEGEDLITYLETGTGITLRSLFGLKVAKSIVPAVLLGCAFFFWLSTGVLQVESYERGALYRFGRCHEILEPGIHFTLPYPFDKVDIYQTEKVQEMVIGYENADKTNLLWSESHGGTEYKLLLGDGNELISVNIRIKYKIDDLREYVTTSAEAEKMLGATAYSVITDLTVHTTLDAMLASDRALLSSDIEGRLVSYLDTAGCGLSVEDVIVESIHPPVEVAQIYRQAVSAQLMSQAAVDRAKGQAAASIAYAQAEKESTILRAEVAQNNQVAEARAAVQEFMAAVEAYETDAGSYCYYKYMDTLAKVYKGQRLYILGKGVDPKYLYFGNGVIIYGEDAE